MKGLIFCVLITIGNLADEKFICPTTDGEYIGRNTHIEAIPTGRFGTNLFKIKDDTEVKALAEGIVKLEKENTAYRILITNSSCEITYFLVDSAHIENGEHVKLGQIIGTVNSNSTLPIKILINGKHISPTFSCGRP